MVLEDSRIKNVLSQKNNFKNIEVFVLICHIKYKNGPSRLILKTVLVVSLALYMKKLSVTVH